MNFTNTDSVGKDWCPFEVWREVASQVKYQVRKQVSPIFDHATDQVYEKINPIKTKIKQEINK